MLRLFRYRSCTRLCSTKLNFVHTSAYSSSNAVDSIECSEPEASPASSPIYLEYYKRHAKKYYDYKHSPEVPEKWEEFKKMEMKRIERVVAKAGAQSKDRKSIKTPAENKHSPRFDFSSLGLSPPLVECLSSHQVLKPSSIQTLSIPEIIKGSSVFLASETGSGKTFAYALPILELLLRDALLKGTIPRIRHPRAVVFVPTLELCVQVRAEFRKFKKTGIRTLAAGITSKLDSFVSSTAFDVLVTTPKRFIGLVDQSIISCNDVQYCVVDEADYLLLDEKYLEDMKPCFEHLNSSYLKFVEMKDSSQFDASHIDLKPIQYISSSASVPTGLPESVVENCGNYTMLRSPDLHRPLKNISYRFIRATATDSRAEKFFSILKTDCIPKKEKVLIFFESSKSLIWGSIQLKQHGIQHSRLVGSDDRKIRHSNFRAFEQGDTDILLSTDLGARGIDFHVDHVLMFDSPKDITSFLHRSGRTGRMGKPGKVTVLICKRSLAENLKIESFIRHKKSLCVNSLIEYEKMALNEIGDKRKVMSKESRKQAMLMQRQQRSTSKATSEREKLSKPSSKLSKKDLWLNNQRTSSKQSSRKETDASSARGKPSFSERRERSLHEKTSPSNPGVRKGRLEGKNGASRWESEKKKTNDIPEFVGKYSKARRNQWLSRNH